VRREKRRSIESIERRRRVRACVLGIVQLRGMLDDDLAVDLDDVQHVQHVALINHLLRLRRKNTRHSVLISTANREKRTVTRSRRSCALTRRSARSRRPMARSCPTSPRAMDRRARRGRRATARRAAVSLTRDLTLEVCLDVLLPKRPMAACAC
jgi:hypothetical protein